MTCGLPVACWALATDKLNDITAKKAINCFMVWISAFSRSVSPMILGWRASIKLLSSERRRDRKNLLVPLHFHGLSKGIFMVVFAIGVDN
jgi:hypothetical protein